MAKRGIDISSHQGDINLAALKSQIDFVIIRVGYGVSGSIDTKFKRNADLCKSLGIPFGFYWYSYALDVNGAKQEATNFLNAIAPYKNDYSMGCWFAYLETIGIHIKFVNVAPGNNATEAFWCASSEEFQKDYEILPDDCVKVDQYTFVEISSNDYDIVLSPVAFWNFFPNIENFVHFAVENFLDNLQCCYRNSKIDLSDPDTEIGLIEQIHQP